MAVAAAALVGGVVQMGGGSAGVGMPLLFIGSLR